MEEPQAPAIPVNNQKTILVVDDDPTILAFVSRLVRDGGHHVLAAVNGENALELARLCPDEIHLLLTDFEMPRISGIELATKISIGRPEIKVLMMSGFAGGTLVLNEGWHFLPKPFVASQLRAIVTTILLPHKSFRP